MPVDITTTTNSAGAPPDVTEINDNFDLIKAELDAFPQNGAFKANAIDNASYITNQVITWDHLNPTVYQTAITDVDTAVPTSGAIVDYLQQPRGVFPGFSQYSLSVGAGNKEPSNIQAVSLAISKVLCVNCEVCFTDYINDVSNERWYQVNHTYRASGTDGGRHFGSSWYYATGVDSLALQCNVFYGGMSHATPATEDKTVRWTIFYKE
jgi:hypothetical protein